MAISTIACLLSYPGGIGNIPPFYPDREINICEASPFILDMYHRSKQLKIIKEVLPQIGINIHFDTINASRFNGEMSTLSCKKCIEFATIFFATHFLSNAYKNLYEKGTFGLLEAYTTHLKKLLELESKRVNTLTPKSADNFQFFMESHRELMILKTLLKERKGAAPVEIVQEYFNEKSNPDAYQFIQSESDKIFWQRYEKYDLDQIMECLYHLKFFIELQIDPLDLLLINTGTSESNIKTTQSQANLAKRIKKRMPSFFKDKISKQEKGEIVKPLISDFLEPKELDLRHYEILKVKLPIDFNLDSSDSNSDSSPELSDSETDCISKSSDYFDLTGSRLLESSDSETESNSELSNNFDLNAFILLDSSNSETESSSKSSDSDSD